MGAGRSERSANLKKNHWSAVGSWLVWSGMWTAALGFSLFLSLRAVGHQGQQAAAPRAAAATEQNSPWYELADAQEQEESQRVLFSHTFLFLMGVSLLGGWTIHEQRVRGRQRQADLLEQEWAFLKQLDDCPDGLCIIQDNIIRYANGRLAAMVGVPVSEMTASPVTSLLAADEPARFGREIGRLADTSDGVRFDSALLPPEGSRFEVEVHAGNTVFAGRDAYFLVLREIGTRKQREEATETSRAFLQDILNGMAESLMVFDADYRLLLMNKAARLLYGDNVAAIHSPFCFHLMHRDAGRCQESGHACPMRRVVESKKSCLVIHNHQTKDGGEIPVEIMASPIFDQKGEITDIIEVGRDISHWLRREEEQKEIAETLLCREKEEAVATLVGGLAHDYNNTLAVILGNAELLRLNMVDGEEEPELIENICQAAQRMADLNRQLLAYAKLGPKHLRPLVLNRLVQEVLRLQSPPAAIRCHQHLAADLWPVRADDAQMRQLFGNLLANAFEILGEGGGEVAVATGNVRMKKSFQHGGRQLPAGDYIRARVSDSGPGIGKGIRTKIFDPFFSTKFIGRGLGLAAAKGIVESHGGAIAVENGREQGCVFELFLPSAPQEEEGEKDASRPAAILVVENDPEMMMVFTEILSGAGYGEVLAAGTGEKGLELLTRKQHELALVVLDIRLPGISGREVYRQVRRKRAGIRVLVASGSPQEEALAGLSFHPQDAFLQKPFAKEALLGEVERLVEMKNDE